MLHFCKDFQFLLQSVLVFLSKDLNISAKLSTSYICSCFFIMLFYIYTVCSNVPSFILNFSDLSLIYFLLHQSSFCQFYLFKEYKIAFEKESIKLIIRRQLHIPYIISSVLSNMFLKILEPQLAN